MRKANASKHISKYKILMTWILVSCLVLMLVAPAFAEQPLKDQSQEPFKFNKYAGGEILVKFKKDASQESIRSLNKDKKTKVKEKLSRVSVQRLQVPAGKTVSEAIKEYEKDPKVEFAEPNYTFTADIVPDDYYYSYYQWNMPKIGAPEAWDVERGQTNQIVVAVIDTGVDVGHPDLNDQIVQGYDFVNEDTDPSDDHGHGSHVAGIIGAESNNGQGVAGVAWSARIMPVKVLNSWGSGYLSDVVSGITYAADHGAKVINMSLGSSYNSSSLQSAINYAHSKGVTVVAAAGNDGNGTINYPGGCNYTIGVAATDQNDNRASFSNYNSTVDVAAPGVSIASTWYRGEAYYALASGTSMATPHVAGLAALLLSQDPSRSPETVENMIESTADDLGPSGYDVYYGAGRINAYLAVFEDENFVASSTWYFAEGYTGEGFEEWLTLQNPNDSALTAHVTYMFRGGSTWHRHVLLDAQSRQTVDVNSEVGEGKEFSILVEASEPIVAERPMYFNYRGVWADGDDTIGATSPASEWYFAEGYTGEGFEEWLTLQNPNDGASDVTVTYMFKGGGTQVQGITIGANSRETIDVNGVVGPGKDVSIKVTSSLPIVAERPMYFNYKGMWSGGHDAMGYSQ